MGFPVLASQSLIAPSEPLLALVPGVAAHGQAPGR
jgi:hypothetical protein